MASELQEKIAQLARGSHPADLPSRVDLVADGTITFVRNIDADTGVNRVVARMFRVLGVGLEKTTAPIIKRKFDRYQKLHPEDEVITQKDFEQDTVLSPQSSLRTMFETWRQIAVEGEADNIQLLTKAEHFGCFVVECAMGIEHIGCCNQPNAPEELRTAS